MFDRLEKKKTSLVSWYRIPVEKPRTNEAWDEICGSNVLCNYLWISAKK